MSTPHEKGWEELGRKLSGHQPKGNPQTDFQAFQAMKAAAATSAGSASGIAGLSKTVLALIVGGGILSLVLGALLLFDVIDLRSATEFEEVVAQRDDPGGSTESAGPQNPGFGDNEATEEADKTINEISSTEAAREQTIDSTLATEDQLKSRARNEQTNGLGTSHSPQANIRQTLTIEDQPLDNQFSGFKEAPPVVSTSLENDTPAPLSETTDVKGTGTGAVATTDAPADTTTGEDIVSEVLAKNADPGNRANPSAINPRNESMRSLPERDVPQLVVASPSLRFLPTVAPAAAPKLEEDNFRKSGGGHHFALSGGLQTNSFANTIDDWARFSYYGYFGYNRKLGAKTSLELRLGYSSYGDSEDRPTTTFLGRQAEEFITPLAESVIFEKSTRVNQLATVDLLVLGSYHVTEELSLFAGPRFSTVLNNVARINTAPDGFNLFANEPTPELEKYDLGFSAGLDIKFFRNWSLETTIAAGMVRLDRNVAEVENTAGLRTTAIKMGLKTRF